MKTDQLLEFMTSLFETTEKEAYFKESGMTVDLGNEITRVGYCVNLTRKTVEQAVKNKVDLMITHHDAWDSIDGMKEACSKDLNEAGISHYFNHLPLDDAAFGTNERLANAIGLDKIDKSHPYEGFDCGRIGSYDQAIEFSELVKRMESILDEPVKSWQFNDRKIKKVGIVCGGGFDTGLLKTAHDNACDVYITGEKILYTVQYAQLVEMNLIVGSHTFIELLGIEGLANRIDHAFSQLELIKLEEEHIE